jgi:rubrerythrin
VKAEENTDRRFVEGLHAAWQREMWTARTYQALAAREANDPRRDVLLQLAATEDGHAERWALRLKELGVVLPPYSEKWRDRLRRWVLVQSGTDNALKRMEDWEDRDTAEYQQLAATAPSNADREAIAAAQADEERHSRLLFNPAPARSDEPQALLDVILRRERWHTRSGGWIGQAIYGANDGLGAVFGIVSGVAGATGGSHVVLISGLAGMLASALSMGSGAFLATKSERSLRSRATARTPRNGHPSRRGTRRAGSLLPAQRILARRSSGIGKTPCGPARPGAQDTGSRRTGVERNNLISTLAHFGIGAAKTVVTGRSPWKSGLEMTVVGVGEAAITYLLGLAFGQVIS